MRPLRPAEHQQPETPGGAHYPRGTRRKEVGAAYREVMGKNYPAMAVVEVKGLVEDGARLEIETTAVIPK